MQLSDKFVSSQLLLLEARRVGALAQPQMAGEAALDVNNNTAPNRRRKWGKPEELKAWKQRSIPASGGNSLHLTVTAFQEAPASSPSSISPRLLPRVAPTSGAFKSTRHTFVDKLPPTPERKIS